MRSNNIIDAIGNTPLVELASFSSNPNVKIFAKLEGNNPTGSVKDRIARAMIQDAESTGLLKDGRILLEPTSGNTGISLAMIASLKGYEIHVVMPENVGSERIELLSAYGAGIMFSPGEQGTNGAIRMAQDLAAKDDRYMMLYQ